MNYKVQDRMRPFCNDCGEFVNDPHACFVEYELKKLSLKTGLERAYKIVEVYDQEHCTGTGSTCVSCELCCRIAKELE